MASCCIPRAAMPDSPTFAVLCDAVDLSSNATTTYVASVSLRRQAATPNPCMGHGLMCHGDPSQRQDGVLSSMFALAEASPLRSVLYTVRPREFVERAVANTTTGDLRRRAWRMRNPALWAADWVWEPSRAHGTLVVGSGLAPLKGLRRTPQPHLCRPHVPCRECGWVSGPHGHPCFQSKVSTQS